MTNIKLTELYRQNSKAMLENDCVIQADSFIQFLSIAPFRCYVDERNYSKVILLTSGNRFELQYTGVNGIKAVYLI